MRRRVRLGGRRRRPAATVALAAIAFVTLVGVLAWAMTGGRAALRAFVRPPRVVDGPSLSEGRFTGPDAERQRVAVRLTPVAERVVTPTDIQFVPGDDGLMLVLEKGGAIRWFDLERRRAGTLLVRKVLADSEQGLLGLAFHPRFRENGRFYLNATVPSRTAPPAGMTSVESWTVAQGADLRRARPQPERVLLEVEQPYDNHNAGQLAFGPDGYLYVGLGDGGSANDPHGHGQDLTTLLGTMLRIDVDRSDAPLPYGIPADNPFVAHPRAAARAEIWAYGLRNPWRYSFDPKGRLLVADVGQNLWEELDILEAGGNYGWNVKEGFHCFPPNSECSGEGLSEPIYEYGRADGASITGGFVAFGGHVPELDGKYVFGDFVTGRIWALELPSDPQARVEGASVRALGQWPMTLSTFGQDSKGRIYVAAFSQGVIYRVDPG